MKDKLFKKIKIDGIVSDYYENLENKELIIIMRGLGTKYTNYFPKNFIKNYDILQPHYAGSHGSEGKYLQKNPSIEILNILKKLNKKYEKIILIGTSLGGGITLSLYKNFFEEGNENEIKKVILLAPVLDGKRMLEEKGKIKRFLHKRKLENYLKKNPNYDCVKGCLNKYFNNEIISTHFNQKIHNTKKIILIHSEDDNLIPLNISKEFKKENPKIKLTILKEEGHYLTKSDKVIKIILKEIKN